MKKKSDDKKAEELLYLASLNSKFQEDVKSVRVKYRIPSGGFFSKKDYMNWTRRGLSIGPRSFMTYENKELSDKPMDFTKDITSLLKKYKLPPTLFSLMKNYIYFDNEVDMEGVRGSYFGCAIEIPENSLPRLSVEKRWKNSGKKYIRLLIHESATKEDVKRYVAENWETIQKSMYGHGKKPESKRIRSKTNKKRDEWIYKKSLLTRKELGLGKGEYKHIHIVTKVNELFDENLSSDTVKKIITRERNIRKGDI